MKTTFYTILGDNVNAPVRLTNFTSNEFDLTLRHLLENITSMSNWDPVDNGEYHTTPAINVTNIYINGTNTVVNSELVVTLAGASSEEDYVSNDLSTDVSLHAEICQLLSETEKTIFTITDLNTNRIYEFGYLKGNEVVKLLSRYYSSIGKFTCTPMAFSTNTTTGKIDVVYLIDGSKEMQNMPYDDFMGFTDIDGVRVRNFMIVPVFN